MMTCTAFGGDTSSPFLPGKRREDNPGIQDSTDDRFPVSKDLLQMEREARRFHREVNQVDYASWRKLLRRVRTDRRYRVSHFGLPEILTRDALLALAHVTLVERNCTYVDSLREVGPEYEIPVEDYWETHTDPQTGRTLVDGHETTFGTSPS